MLGCLLEVSWLTGTDAFMWTCLRLDDDGRSDQIGSRLGHLGCFWVIQSRWVESHWYSMVNCAQNCLVGGKALIGTSKLGFDCDNERSHGLEHGLVTQKVARWSNQGGLNGWWMVYSIVNYVGNQWWMVWMAEQLQGLCLRSFDPLLQIGRRSFGSVI